ncbi:hypothetical protein F6455_04145 [Proteobacteria bacterium 005FR1]|nr:hypothetical protein [Proteobacteria bacterium 005FR1]
MKNFRRGKGHFFVKDEGWFFGDEKGTTMGPFDYIIEIVMGECVMGEWKCEQRELTGDEVEEALALLA